MNGQPDSSPDGLRPDRIIRDEIGSDEPRREVIIQRADGSTYSAEFPESTDLGEVLEPGEVVAFDAWGES